MIHLMLDQLDSYRQVCQQILEGIQVNGKGDMTWSCAIGAMSLRDVQAVLPVLREVSARRSAVYGTTEQLSLGALLYRGNNVEEAVEQLMKVSRMSEQYGATTGRTDKLPGYAWYFLAMALHDLGHFQEARTWFDKAETYTETTLAKPATVGQRLFSMPGSIYWHQRVALQHLQREARTVLNISDPKPK